jgi:hypothetical protein
LGQVTVHYFEGATFREQIDFFTSSDIVLSPHGAQLTGLVHMANKPCTSLMELFPHHYGMAYYFGSLAGYSGVDHSYMYLSQDINDTVFMPWEARFSNNEKRSKVRSQDLCPSMDIMVYEVLDMVNEWYKCCQPLNYVNLKY